MSAHHNLAVPAAVHTVQEHGQVHRLLGKAMACDEFIQSSLVALKAWL